jgi:pimeloyl-ACP methyl ester carboxylesterase
MSDSRVWQQTATELSKTYQLHLVSIAGFAGQPAIEGALLPVVKTELLDYIKTKQLQRPAIIGHSLGAFLAYDLASSAPDKIGKIIAVDGLPFLAPLFTRDSNSTVTSVKAQAEGIRNFYAQMQPAQLAATMQQGMEIQAREPATRERVQQMGAQSDPKAVGQAIYELLSTDLRDKVSNISQPTTLRIRPLALITIELSTNIAITSRRSMNCREVMTISQMCGHRQLNAA